MRFSRLIILSSVIVGAASTVAAVFMFRGRAVPPSKTSTAEKEIKPILYRPMAIGAPASEFKHPWVAHVEIADLDRDGLLDILYTEGQSNTVRLIRQSPRGVYKERILASDIHGPAHVSVADVNGDGRLDVLVASMGQILPTNDPIGAVVVLENLGNEQFREHVVAQALARVADVRAANFAGHKDGTLDLAVGQFGYLQGEVSWMENLGDWKFKRHVVNTQSGCIHTPFTDFDGDGLMDFAALLSQEWEEVHLFHNEGGGKFQDRVIWGSTNEDFGSSGLTAADLNRDGRPDLVLTCGDGLDYAAGATQPWHGLQWLENLGGLNFRFHRVGTLPGAFSPAVIDLNGDGNPDIIAVSAFNDWHDPNAASMVAWINNGDGTFQAEVLAHQPTHLISVAAGDLDGNGVPVLVTGGFYLFPPYGEMNAITLWRHQ